MSTNAPRNTGSGCVSREVLVSYAQGKLPPARLEQVALHLEKCGRCSSELLALPEKPDTLVRGLRQARDHAAAGSEAYEQVIGKIESMGTLEARALLGSEPATLRRLGNYELGPRLGAGGMGEVYRARHVHLGKIRAVKLLPDEHLNKPHRIARFIREMQAIGKLEHPNIVQAYDAEVQGTPFLAMEYIEGIDLAKLVVKRGPLAVADACELVRQAADGLQCAHEAGLVHRDIKPSNLMLTRGGVVKVLDLGLALLREDDQPDNSLSRAHPVGGTPEYMAPEQIEASHEVDVRADLYSLGCTLYHLLAGRPPFHDCPSKIQAHLLMRPPPLGNHRSDLPAGLADVVERLLAKELAARYATPAELTEALRPFVAGSNLRELVATDDAIVPPAAGTDAPGTRSTHKSVPVPPVPPPVPKVDTNAVAIRPSCATADTRKWLAACLALCALSVVLLSLWGGGMLKVKTQYGTIVLENLPTEEVEVTLDGAVATLKLVDGKYEISALPSGNHRLQVKKDGFKVFGEEVEIAVGDRKSITVRLERPPDQLLTSAGNKSSIEIKELPPPIPSDQAISGTAQPVIQKPVPVPEPPKEPTVLAVILTGHAGKSLYEHQFYSNGRIGSPDGSATWELSRDYLITKWPDKKAPGGFWVDTAKVSPDGTRGIGRNQIGIRIEVRTRNGGNLRELLKERDAAP